MIQQNEFNFIVRNLSRSVIDIIQKNDGLSFLDATISFYSSELYKKLSRETTKVWHLSACQLYDIYKDEKETGILSFDMMIRGDTYKNPEVKNFCISVLEAYRTSHNIPGESAMKLFAKFNVFRFLNKNYGALHTQSLRNTCLDVDEFIGTRQKQRTAER